MSTQRRFNRFVASNNIISISASDADNTEFTSCDILGEHADCYECIAADVAGNEFTLYITSTALACWLNDDWSAYE